MATEVALAIRDHAFGPLGLTRLISLIDPKNASSIRVAEKTGLRYERNVCFFGKQVTLHAIQRD